MYHTIVNCDINLDLVLSMFTGMFDVCFRHETSDIWIHGEFNRTCVIPQEGTFFQTNNLGKIFSVNNFITSKSFKIVILMNKNKYQ